MSATPEGRILAAELATARLRVAGVRACSCGRPDCQLTACGVTLTVDGVTVMATTQTAVEQIVEALREASAFVWPEGGAK